MKIKKLSDEVIRKISAGEVITGTFAVVKELVENSIDAGADTITVEISDGGKTYIKISDNGCGMSADDIKLSIQEHTTSKINDIDDLFTLKSFGFRGEALSSISSVSRFRIISKTADEDTATEIDTVAGEIIGEKKCVHNVGTTIEVRDLFFNIPARRKFLKSNAAESRNVTDIVEKIILDKTVNIKYIRDGKVIYDIKKEYGLKEKLNIIFPETETENFIDIDYTDENFNIKGIVSNPGVNRFNRTGQVFFVNNRYVKTGDLFYIFERAYGEMLEKGKHPYCIIFIETDPAEVDVNIHPQKLEVKFSDSAYVNNILKKTVREALINYTNYKINFVKKEAEPLSENDSNQYIITENIKTENIKNDEGYFLKEKNYDYTKNENVIKKDIPVYNKNNFYEGNNRNTVKYNFENTIKNDIKEKIFRENTEEVSDYRIVGVVNQRYLIVEEKSKLSFIDFHAAHERYIFEILKKEFSEKGSISSQKLLLPIKLSLSDYEVNILNEKNDFMKKIGFSIEFSEKEAVITDIPGNFNFKNINEMIHEIIDYLRLDGIESTDKIFDDILATVSCRSAVKTGDDVKGLETLVENIYRMKLKHCPHGRPIKMEVEFSELDSFFKRT